MILSRFTCQLAVTEVNYNQIDADIYPQVSTQSHVIHNPIPPNFRNLNFEFAMDLDSDIRGQNKAECAAESNHRQHIEAIRLFQQQRPRSDSASGRLNSQGTLRRNISTSKEHSLNGDMYDTFEQCLHVTNQMESIMAYHYQDENNKGCYRFEEIYTFREGEIDLSSPLTVQEDNDTGSPSRARSLSLGQHHHMKEDLEEFIGHRSEVIVKEAVHKEKS